MLCRRGAEGCGGRLRHLARATVATAVPAGIELCKAAESCLQEQQQECGSRVAVIWVLRGGAGHPESILSVHRAAPTKLILMEEWFHRWCSAPQWGETSSQSLTVVGAMASEWQR